MFPASMTHGTLRVKIFSKPRGIWKRNLDTAFVLVVASRSSSLMMFVLLGAEIFVPLVILTLRYGIFQLNFFPETTSQKMVILLNMHLTHPELLAFCGKASTARS